MSKPTDPEVMLASFMAKYTPEIASRAQAIREQMQRLYPHALELVYDNYNALAIGYGPSEKASEAIFSIALYPRWVSLFFLQARGLSDPDHLLKGSGSVAKHVVLSSSDMLHHPPLRQLMRQAEEIAKVPFSDQEQSRLIIKSVSSRQRPRMPSAAKPQTRSSSLKSSSASKARARVSR